MSHPAEISCRCNRTISRIRRRMRFRLTALPSAFLMLHPNRLSSRPLARRKTANSRLVRRRPSRYTASYSDRRTNRLARGNSCGARSDARETVAPLLPAGCKYFPSTLALHSCAESVLLMSAAHMRLKRPFRQRSFSSAFRSISLVTTYHAPSGYRSGESPATNHRCFASRAFHLVSRVAFRRRRGAARCAPLLERITPRARFCSATLLP